MATKVQLVGGAFQDSEGNVLANGYLELKLNADNAVTGAGNLCAGVLVRIDLDSAGNVASLTSTPPATNQFIWATSVMLVANAFYRVVGKKANGQYAWGPNNQQIVGDGGTFDLGTWIPNKVISWTPSVQSPVIQVNGVPLSSQADVDFEDSDSVTFTDDGDGVITAHTAGSSGSVSGFYSNGSLISQSISSTGSAMQSAANSVTGLVFNLATACVVNKIRMVQVGGNNPNANISLAIYDSGKNKIIDSGAIVQNVGSDTVITTTLGAPVSLQPGTYYFAQSAQLIGSPSGPVSTYVYGQIVNPGNDPGTGLYAAAIGSAFTAANVRAGNVMPATLGALTPLLNGNITMAIFSTT